MPLLKNQSKNILLAGELEKAESFAARSKGLLGRKGLTEEQALWIKSCKSIHSFFMRFSFDAIFVDQQLIVKAVYPSFKPWRLSRLVFSADSVFELCEGKIQQSKTEVGDQLDVVD